MSDTYVLWTHHHTVILDTQLLIWPGCLPQDMESAITWWTEYLAAIHGHEYITSFCCMYDSIMLIITNEVMNKWMNLKKSYKPDMYHYQS